MPGLAHLTLFRRLCLALLASAGALIVLSPTPSAATATACSVSSFDYDVSAPFDHTRCMPGTVAQPDALRLMLPAGSERRILVRTSALRLAAKAVSVANKAAELRAIAGRNRVSIETPNGRLSVDLEGKAHFDKTLGRYVDTPHVKFDTRHVGPDGRVSYTSGSVREATHADLRLVARVLAKRGR